LFFGLVEQFLDCSVPEGSIVGNRAASLRNPAEFAPDHRAARGSPAADRTAPPVAPVEGPTAPTRIDDRIRPVAAASDWPAARSRGGRNPASSRDRGSGNSGRHSAGGRGRGRQK